MCWNRDIYWTLIARCTSEMLSFYETENFLCISDINLLHIYIFNKITISIQRISVSFTVDEHILYYSNDEEIYFILIMPIKGTINISRQKL